MPRALLVVACFVTSCTFDASLPDAGDIRCTDASQCPPGFECRVRLQRCLRSGTNSPVAPRVVSATVTPPLARAGTAVHVALRVDQPLAEAPRLRLFDASGATEVALTSAEGGSFTYVYAVTGAEAEGSAALLADLVGTSGTEALAQAVGAVTLDFTPPSAATTAFGSPRSADDAGVLLARPADFVAVRVATTETVRPGVRLSSQTACDAGLAFPASTTAGSVFDFPQTAAPQHGCTYRFALEGAVDVAGNAAPPLPLPLELRVDGVSPELTALHVERPGDAGTPARDGFSRQPGFDRFTLRFHVDETASHVWAEALGRVLNCQCTAGDCACPDAVRAADVAADHPWSAHARDAAGNEARVGATGLRFDFSPPALLPAAAHLAVTPPSGCPLPAVTALSSQGTATVELALDEPGTAALRSTRPGVGASLRASTGTHFTFDVTATSQATTGLAPLEVVATDAVGNAAVLPVPLALAVDTLPPAAAAVATEGAVVLHRTPWGVADAGSSVLVEGAAGAVEPGAWVQVVATAPVTLVPSADGGFHANVELEDRPVLSVRPFDGACNAGPLSRIRDVEWVASLRGKLVGSDFENPHALWTTARAGTLALGNGRVEVAPRPRVTQVGRGAWSRPGLPSGRYGGALVHDTWRDVLVQFGGQAVNANDELWEFDLRTRSWSEPARLGERPGPRTNHAMAFDEARGRVVLFGGDSSGVQSDLWEYDGLSATWRNRTPTPRPSRWPSARQGHALLYHPGLRAVLLVGGAPSAEVWAWDGARAEWTNLAPGATQPALSLAAVALDTDRDRVVTFGGFVAGARSDQLWEWAPDAGWVDRTPAARPTQWPTGRHATTGVYDATARRFLVFGGGTPVAVDQLWAWNGEAGTWENLTPTPRPPSWPPLRAFAAGVYDRTRREALFFGGQAPAPSARLDVWDGGAWTSLGAVRTTPAPPRYWHAATYDSRRSVVVVFGGTPESGASDELWELDTHTWQWANRTPTPRPPSWASARLLSSLEYLPSRDVSLLLGGQLSAGGLADGLSEWRSDAGTFTFVTPAPRPLPSRNGALAYDSARDRVLLYGGLITDGGPAGAGLSDELWEYEPGAATWINRTPAARPAAWPPAVYGPGVYAAGRGSFLVVAGTHLWEWREATQTWTNLRPGGAVPWPSSRVQHAVTWDGARERVLLFGGNAGGDELWEYTFDGGWADLTPSPRPADWPSERAAATLVFDTRRARAVLVGGLNASGDVWEFGPDAVARPGVQAGFRFAAAGVEAGATLKAVEVRAVAGGQSSADDGGVALEVSWGDALRVEATSGAGLTAPAPLVWRTTDAARLATIFEGPQRLLSVRVTPLNPNGDGKPAQVRLDDVAVTVRYRLP